jgi:hypothetical protein
MAQNLLTVEQWQSIRTIWEYDPGEPTYSQASGRASDKYKFTAPGKTTVAARAKKEGWQRKSSLNGINVAAQRKADQGSNSDGSAKVLDGALDASNPKKEQAARSESEDLRAEVLIRHRTEWKNVAVLRQEALAIRLTNADGAFGKAKLAKITAEMTMIQQIGERKAWGLDIIVDPRSVKDMSDEELESAAAGRPVSPRV